MNEVGKIKILDDFTANKIAAGEVVERPASVIKELVENALDAGSSKIEIQISRGGLDKITVIDNGEGMDREDARLAFHRHATSKIRNDADLDAIATLGFRGEALPSIAAVSTVEVRTRPHNEVCGARLIVEGGKIVKDEDIGCPAGTTITVSNLFANVPARLKNIKSVSLEAGHISDVVSKLAVAYPEVSFSLQHDNRFLFKTSGNGDMLDIIASLYGTETARALLPINAERDGIGINGYIARPSVTRSTRNHQTFIVNRRIVKSRPLSQALEQGYHSLIMTGRYPVAFLNIHLPYNLIDPNVHPAKMEVRLFVLDKISDLLSSAVKVALSSNTLIPETKIPVEKPSGIQNRNQAQYVQQFLDVDEGHYHGKQAECSLVKEGSPVLAELPDRSIADEPQDEPQKEPQKEPQDIPLNMLLDLPRRISLDTPYNYFPKDKVIAGLRPIGQIDCTYIVAQGREAGLYLIDQHAAHERILYEKNMQVPTTNYSQLLAIPQHIELTHLEAQVLITNILEFQAIGFVIEHFGGDSFLLRGVPGGFPPGKEKKIFLDLLDYFFSNQHKLTNKELREDLIIMMSCKAAIKAGDRLLQGQMEKLLADLSNTELPYTCPHGRPTVIHISGYELEKMFKRVL
ncbi:DNA mismatch repair endonuclease MutL [Thermincola potens]|uniref:DNA mismatch repair endonuclease MutL n=1 Tax=Thermincola potens TaxID=863643 RepID=UPI0009FF8B03|nr:DNA mismatch repair endonuclease MutL [Thermincola potens]